MTRDEFARQVGQMAQRWIEGPPTGWKDPSAERWTMAFIDVCERLGDESVDGYIVRGAGDPILSAIMVQALAARSSMRQARKTTDGIQAIELDGTICAHRFSAPATRYGVERAMKSGAMTEDDYGRLRQIAIEREVRREDLPSAAQPLCYSWGH